MKNNNPLPFLKNLKYIVLIVFLLRFFSLEAFPSVKNIFSTSISEILKQEYTLKTYQELREFMEEHSIEDLIVLGNRGNLRVQRMAFFLYYYLTKTESTFSILLGSNEFVLISPDILFQIKTLLQKNRTPEAWFVKGLLQLRKGNYREGLANLNEAKKAGHALAYLAHLKFSLINPDVIDPASHKELIYQTLREMEQRNITVPGFSFLMGSILFIRDELEEAKKRFIKALKNPTFRKASKSYIGLIYSKNGQYALAKQYLTETSQEGTYVVKPRLLEIYLQEGNYKRVFELLQEIALQWGRYTNIASIKASFLLSYMTERGLGTSADPVQSYIWADRANKIYHISQDENIPKTFNAQTGRYMLLPDSFTFHHTVQATTTSEHSPQSFSKMDDPPFIFRLMSFKQTGDRMTARQLRYIDTHFYTLTETLNQQGKLQRAHSAANTIFKDLHFLPVGGACPQIGFAN